MTSTDPAYLALLPATLRSTEQQLLAAAVLCREAAIAAGRPALVSAAGRPARRAAADSTQPPADELPRAPELAARLRGLGAALTQQAEALQSSADGIPAERVGGPAVPLEMSASEAERARIARDLHDGPAQYFANAVFEIEYLRKLLMRDPGAVGDGLARLRESLQQGVKEIRQCLFELRLPAAEEVGLVALLHGYLPEY